MPKVVVDEGPELFCSNLANDILQNVDNNLAFVIGKDKIFFNTDILCSLSPLLFDLVQTWSKTGCCSVHGLIHISLNDEKYLESLKILQRFLKCGVIEKISKFEEGNLEELIKLLGVNISYEKEPSLEIEIEDIKFRIPSDVKTKDSKYVEGPVLDGNDEQSNNTEKSVVAALADDEEKRGEDNVTGEYKKTEDNSKGDKNAMPAVSLKLAKSEEASRNPFYANNEKGYRTKSQKSYDLPGSEKITKAIIPKKNVETIGQSQTPTTTSKVDTKLKPSSSKVATTKSPKTDSESPKDQSLATELKDNSSKPKSTKTEICVKKQFRVNHINMDEPCHKRHHVVDNKTVDKKVDAPPAKIIKLDKHQMELKTPKERQMHSSRWDIPPIGDKRNPFDHRPTGFQEKERNSFENTSKRSSQVDLRNSRDDVRREDRRNAEEPRSSNSGNRFRDNNQVRKEMSPMLSNNHQGFGLKGNGMNPMGIKDHDFGSNSHRGDNGNSRRDHGDGFGGEQMTCTMRAGSGGGELEKNGDWNCPECGYLNFQFRKNCMRCDGAGSAGPQLDGNWNCPECGSLNYHFRGNCYKCENLKDGNWNCPECGYLNYHFRDNCYKCEVANPKGLGGRRPGDWDCIKCGTMNFASRSKCYRINCDSERP